MRTASKYSLPLSIAQDPRSCAFFFLPKKLARLEKRNVCLLLVLKIFANALRDRVGIGPQKLPLSQLPNLFVIGHKTCFHQNAGTLGQRQNVKKAWLDASVFHFKLILNIANHL